MEHEESESDSEESVTVVEEDPELDNDYQPKRKKPKIMRSKYYNFFVWMPDSKDSRTGKWKCKEKACGSELMIPVGGGTSNLKNHITRRHRHLIAELGEKNPRTGVQQDIRELLSKSSTSIKEQLTEAGFRDKLVNFIVASNQPFSLVEEEEFCEFVRYCSRNAAETKLPCAKTVKKCIMSSYEDAKVNLKHKLQTNDGKISFIVDGWTSGNQNPFQGVIGTYVNSDWELCTTIIDLTLLEGSHTGENICGAFVSVLDDFELWDKLMAVTTDNASNMNTMFEHLDQIATERGSPFCAKNNRVRCFAHILNLCCKAIIKSNSADIDESSGYEYNEDIDNDEAHNQVELIITPSKSYIDVIVEKIRSAVISIRGSPQRRQKFKWFCKVSNIPFKMLVRDIDIRWNSTLLMLERALELKDPLEATLNSDSKLRTKLLSEDDWKNITLLIEILKPFREATIVLSSQHSPTLSQTSAIYSALFLHLEKYMKENSSRSSKNSGGQRKYPEWLEKAATKGWEKLSKYYQSSDGEVYIIATVLDPRCNLDFCKKANWKKEWIDNSKKVVTEIWKARYKGPDPGVSGSSADESDSRTTSIFDNMFGPASASRKTADDELNKYLSQKSVKSDMLKKELTGVDGALGWWKIHQTEYPRLSRMAKDYLGILGSGVAIEQFFCTGGDLVSPRRKGLASKSITVSMCLKNWKKNEKSQRQSYYRGVKSKLIGDEEIQELEL